jgi:hypothetical protein
MIQLQTEQNRQTQMMTGQLALQLEDKRRQNMILEKDLDTRSQMIVRNFDSIKTIDEIMAKILAQAGADVTNLKVENDLQAQLDQNGLNIQVPQAPMAPGGMPPQQGVPQGAPMQ